MNSPYAQALSHQRKSRYNYYIPKLVIHHPYWSIHMHGVVFPQVMRPLRIVPYFLHGYDTLRLLWVTVGFMTSA